MLALHQVSLRRGTKLLFEKASFQLHPGQRLGVVGANGSGKSSLLAMLLGDLETDAGQCSIGQDLIISHVRQESPGGSRSALDFVLDGDDEFRAVQAAIAKAEQQAGGPGEALHDLYEQMENIDGYRAEARGARLLAGLGFAPDAVGRPVDSFSGGWRMRLNLAQALMCRSDMLLLDEPTNHLDLPAILWLEQQLTRYPGMLLVISHDRDFLDGVCTRIAHIERQAIRVYTGNYSAFEDQRAAQLAQQQALHLKQQKDIAHLQGFVDRFRYKASKARQAQSRLKMMERMTHIAPAHVDSPFRFRFLKPDKQPQHLLKLSDATLGYGRTRVLDAVTISITAGDRIGLLGVNGAGKSTLVKAMSEGDTLIDGERILGRETRIGYFAQHQLDQLNPDESPIGHLRACAGAETEAEQRNYLGRFGFGGERIFEPVAPFSGGEKARLVLALMIRQKPNLLLLDEPTNHLDLEMRQALSVALMEFEGALVVISHDRHLLRSVCDDLYIVHDGELEHFDLGLDDYPSWLRERESGQEADADGSGSMGGGSRRERRKDAAQLRRRLKPQRDRLRAIERQLERERRTLEDVDRRLADESLYTDADRREELAATGRERADLASRIDDLEWRWLEASEALEQAQQEDLQPADAV